MLLGLAACQPTSRVDITERVNLAYEPWADNYDRLRVTRLEDMNRDGKVDCVKYFFIQHERGHMSTAQVSSAFADYAVPEAKRSCKGSPIRSTGSLTAGMVQDMTGLYHSTRAQRERQ